jgi:hypothetical protein
MAVQIASSSHLQSAFALSEAPEAVFQPSRVAHRTTRARNTADPHRFLLRTGHNQCATPNFVGSFL